MRTLLNCFILVCTLTQTSNAQTFKWVRPFGDSGDDVSGATVVDDSGNVYQSGGFVGQIVIGRDTLNSYNLDNPSIFLAKYDKDGNALWAKVMPMRIQTLIYGVEIVKMRINTSGTKVYLVGTVYSQNESGTGNYYAAVKSSGEIIKIEDEANYLTTYDCDLDHEGNLYATGNFINTVNGYDNTLFIVKFDSLMNFKWDYFSKSPKGSTTSIRAMPDGVYIAGEFKRELKLASTSGSDSLILKAKAGINDWDYFIVRYSHDGKVLSGETYNGPTQSSAGPFGGYGDFDKDGNWLLTENVEVNNQSRLSIKKFSPKFDLLKSYTINDPQSCGFSNAWAMYVVLSDRKSGLFAVAKPCWMGSRVYIVNPSGTYTTISLPAIDYFNFYTKRRVFSAFGPDNSIYISGMYEGHGVWGGVVSEDSEYETPDIYLAKYTFPNTTEITAYSITEARIFPNPNSGQFRIQGIFGSFDLVVYSPLGNEIRQFNGVSGDQSIDLPECARGIYLLKILQNGHFVSDQKLIIH